jgi:hypothetical protein
MKAFDGIEREFEERFNHLSLSHGSLDEVSLGGGDVAPSSSSYDSRPSFSKQ